MARTPHHELSKDEHAHIRDISRTYWPLGHLPSFAIFNRKRPLFFKHVRYLPMDCHRHRRRGERRVSRSLLSATGRDRSWFASLSPRHAPKRVVGASRTQKRPRGLWPVFNARRRECLVYVRNQVASAHPAPPDVKLEYETSLGTAQSPLRAAHMSRESARRGDDPIESNWN